MKIIKILSVFLLSIMMAVTLIPSTAMASFAVEEDGQQEIDPPGTVQTEVGQESEDVVDDDVVEYNPLDYLANPTTIYCNRTCTIKFNAGTLAKGYKFTARTSGTYSFSEFLTSTKQEIANPELTIYKFDENTEEYSAIAEEEDYYNLELDASEVVYAVVSLTEEGRGTTASVMFCVSKMVETSKFLQQNASNAQTVTIGTPIEFKLGLDEDQSSMKCFKVTAQEKGAYVFTTEGGKSPILDLYERQQGGGYNQISNMYPSNKNDIKTTVRLESGVDYYFVAYLQKIYEVIDDVDITVKINKSSASETGVDQDADHTAVYLGGVEENGGNVTIKSTDYIAAEPPAGINISEYSAWFEVGGEKYFIKDSETVYLGSREVEEDSDSANEMPNCHSVTVQGGSISKLVLSDGAVQYNKKRYIQGDSYSVNIWGGTVDEIITSKASRCCYASVSISDGSVGKITIGNKLESSRGYNGNVYIRDERTGGEKINVALGYWNGKKIDSNVMKDSREYYPSTISINGLNFNGLETSEEFKDLIYCAINGSSILTLHAVGGKFSNGSDTIKDRFKTVPDNMGGELSQARAVEIPTYKGHTFKGWSVDNYEEFNDEEEYADYSMPENMDYSNYSDLYACWLDDSSPIPAKVEITDDQGNFYNNLAWYTSDENIGNVFRGYIYNETNDGDLSNYHVEITKWDSTEGDSGDYVIEKYDFDDNGLKPEYPLKNCWSMNFSSTSKDGTKSDEYTVRIFASTDYEDAYFDLSFYNNNGPLNMYSYISSSKTIEEGPIEVYVPVEANTVRVYAGKGCWFPEGGYGIREIKFGENDDAIEKTFKFKDSEDITKVAAYKLRFVRKNDERIASLEEKVGEELDNAPKATEDNPIVIKIADPNQLSNYIEDYSRDNKRLSEIVDYNILLNNKFGLAPVKEYRINNTSVYAWSEIGLYDKDGRDVWEIAEDETGEEDTEFAAVDEGKVYYAEPKYSYWIEDTGMEGDVSKNLRIPVKFEYVNVDNDLTAADLQQISKGMKADYSQSIKYEDLAKVNLLANSGLVGSLPSMQEAGSMISAKNPDLYNDLIGDSKFDIKLFSGMSGDGPDSLGSSSESVQICYFYKGVYYYALTNDEEQTQLETTNTIFVDKTSSNYGEAATARVNEYLSNSNSNKKYEASFKALSASGLCEYLKDRMEVPDGAKAAYYTRYGITFYSGETATDADSFIDTFEMWTYEGRKNAFKNGLVEAYEVNGEPLVLGYATDPESNRLIKGKEAYQMYEMVLTSGAEKLSDLYVIEGRDGDSPDLAIPTSSWTDRVEGITTEGSGVDIPIDTYHTAEELTEGDAEYQKIDNATNIDLSNADIYDLNAYSDVSGKEITDFGDGSMKVTIPVEDDVTDVTVAYFDKNGNLSDENFDYEFVTDGNGKRAVEFTTNHFSTYAIFKTGIKQESKAKPTVGVRDTTLPLKKKQSIDAALNLIMTAGDRVSSVSVSNGKIVRVSGATIKGLKKGKATIVINLASGLQTSYVVKVQSSKVKARISLGCPSKLTMHIGESMAIGASKAPVSCKDKFKYKSSKKKVASVSGGTIYAKKAGSAKITVKCGSKKKTIKVKVI